MCKKRGEKFTNMYDFGVWGNLLGGRDVCYGMSGKMESALRAVGERWLAVDQEWVYDEAVDRRGYLLLKRGFDLLVSIFIIGSVLSWLLPLLAVLIKLDSKGPVFFVQQRMGRN